MATKQKVSERTFIDASGVEVDKMELATGARYTLVQAGKTFDIQLGTAGEANTMFAIFGFWTKVGNVVNTVLNNDKEPGTVDDAAEEIAAFIDSVQQGVWRESTGTLRGPKYDTDILSVALLAFLGDKAKGDAAYYKAKLDDTKGETDKANKGYRLKVLGQDAVKELYWAEAAKRGIAKPQATAESLA